MALSQPQSNNRLVKYVERFIDEWSRENLFSAYQGTEPTNIIVVSNELKSGGEQMNIPILARLMGKGKGAGTLVGNEEALDDYGMRQYIDWCRNAIAMKKNQQQAQSADAFAKARPLLNVWADEMRRDETIEAFMALPSESPPIGLGSDEGDRVNGIRYENATATQLNTWATQNSDRVLYGNTTANATGVHATSLQNVDNVNDLYTAASLKLLKFVAKKAQPKIKPQKVENGREYFVCFSGTLPFRDLQSSLDTVDKDARAREGKGMDSNPLFQDGDEQYRGSVAVEIPEIDTLVEEKWTSLLTAGAGSTRVNPVFFCGQSAMSMAVGQMPRATFSKQDDYDFIATAGIELAYGLEKFFKKHPKDDPTNILKQWGVVTGFFANTGT